VRRAWARSVRGNPRGAEGRGRARLRAGVTVRWRGTRKRETQKKKLNVFEGFCRRDFAGGVLASQALLLPVQRVPDSRSQLYCNR
jgi:hypothetical protein